jgi:hypothetical protein
MWEADAHAGFHVYPNPAADQVMIHSGTRGSLVIRTLSGQIIDGFNVQEGVNHVQLHNIPSGMYLIFLETDRGTTSRKLIIQR